MQAGLAVGAITWGAYQLYETIKKKLGDGHKLLSTVVLKEVAISVAGSTVTFLTGGVADALPNLFAYAEGISDLVSEGTKFGTAEGANMLGENAQNLNIGTTFGAAEILMDLVECCKLTGGLDGEDKCTCPEGTVGKYSGENMDEASMKVGDVTDRKEEALPDDTNNVQAIDSDFADVKTLLDEALRTGVILRKGRTDVV